MILKKIPKPESPRISISQARTHIGEGGFFSRGDALVFLQFTDSARQYVRWIWIRQDDGRRVGYYEPEPERLLGGNVINTLNNGQWEMSNVTLEYT